jgi:hypothetical protein
MRTRCGVEGIQLGERFIPTDENDELLVNYLGPSKTFRHISINDIDGFTTYSARYSPSEMIDILGDYYGNMTEQIFICQGTLKS